MAGVTDTLLTVFETQGEKQLFAAYQQLEKELQNLHKANERLVASQAASARSLQSSARDSAVFGKNLKVIGESAGQTANTLAAMNSSLRQNGQVLGFANDKQRESIEVHQAALNEIGKFLTMNQRLVSGQRAQATVLTSQTRNFEQLQGNIARMSGGMQRAAKTLMTGNKELDLLSMRLDRASMMMWKFTISAIPLRRMMTYALGATAGLVGVGVAAINAAADLDRAERAFQAATGSMAEAADTVQYLRDQAPKIRYTLQQVIESGRILTVAGYDAKALLYTMADLAAGVGQAGISIEQASRAFVDAMHGEMRRLRNTFDITREEIERFAGDAVDAQGRIVDKQRWMAAVVQAITEKYGGANAAAMSGITGMWVNFKDELTRVAAAMGELLLPEAITMLKVMSSMLSVLETLTQMPVVGWLMKTALVVGALAAGLTAGAAAAGMLYIELLGLKAAYQTFQTTGTGEQKKMLEAEHQLLMAQQQLAILEAQRAQVLMPLITAQMREQVALEERMMALRSLTVAEATGGDTSRAQARVDAADAEVDAARAATVKLEAAQREVQLRAQIKDYDKQIAAFREQMVDTALRGTEEELAAQQKALEILERKRKDLEMQRRRAANAAGEERRMHGADRQLEVPGLETVREILDEMQPAAKDAASAVDEVKQAEQAVADQRRHVANLEQEIEKRRQAVSEARMAAEEDMSSRAEHVYQRQQEALGDAVTEWRQAQDVLGELEDRQRDLRRERRLDVRTLRYLKEGHKKALDGMRQAWDRLKAGLGAIRSTIGNLATRFQGLVVGMIEMTIAAAAVGAAVKIISNHATRFQRAAEQASKSLDSLIQRLEQMRDIGYQINVPVESMEDRRRRLEEAGEQLQRGTWWERYLSPTTVTFSERMDARDVDPRTRDEIERRLLAEMERNVRERRGNEAWEEWRRQHPEGLDNINVPIDRIERMLAEMQDEATGVAEAARDAAISSGRVEPAGYEGQGIVPGTPGFDTEYAAALAEYARKTGEDLRVVQKRLEMSGDTAEDQAVALGEMYQILADERERDAEGIQGQIDAMEKEGASSEDIKKKKEEQAKALQDAAELQRMATRLTLRDADAQKTNELRRASNEASIEAQTIALEAQVEGLSEELNLLNAAGVETSILTDKNQELADALRDLADAYDDLGEREKARQMRQKAEQKQTEADTGYYKNIKQQIDQQASALEGLGMEEEADRARQRSLRIEAQELAAVRKRNAENLRKMRESGEYSEADLRRMKQYMDEEERAMELQLKQGHMEARTTPLQREADLTAAQARRSEVVAENAERTYQARRRSLELQLKLAREKSDEVAEEEAKAAIWELDKQRQTGMAQRAVDAAEMNKEMAQLQGNYAAADRWELIRIQRLEDLKRVQAAWGMTVEASESAAAQLKGTLQLTADQYERLQNTEEAHLRTMEESGAAVSDRVKQLQKLLIIEQARARQLMSQGRSAEDPEVQEHLANALKYRRQQREAMVGYAKQEYDVLKAMADMDMASQDQVEAARQRAIELARRQIALEKQGSEERLRAWQDYLRLMEDGESQIDKTVAKIIGAPQELLNYISSADMAARFGDVAASLGVGNRPEVSILGKYDNRTLIEIRYGGGAPPSLESAIDAGVDNFVQGFTRVLERGG